MLLTLIFQLPIKSVPWQSLPVCRNLTGKSERGQFNCNIWVASFDRLFASVILIFFTSRKARLYDVVPWLLNQIRQILASFQQYAV